MQRIEPPPRSGQLTSFFNNTHTITLRPAFSFYDFADGLFFHDSVDQLSLCDDRRSYIRLPAKLFRLLARILLKLIHYPIYTVQFFGHVLRTLLLLVLCFVLGLGRTLRLYWQYSYTAAFVPLIPVALFAASTWKIQSAVFWLNLVALLPAIGAYRYGSEVLSAYIPGRLQWLCNAFLGPLSLDLEVAIIGLFQGRTSMVQSFIVGKAVSTSLLTLGLCFLISGTRRGESRFNETVSATLASLLLYAAISYGFLTLLPIPDTAERDSQLAPILSRIVSPIIILIYGGFLLFRRTHIGLFDHELQEEPSELEREEGSSAIQSPGIVFAMILFVGSLVMAYFSGLAILETLGSAQTTSAVFLGYCLLPLLVEMGEISKLGAVAYRDEMDRTLQVAAGTCVNTTLLMGPLLVMLGWIVGQPLSLRLGLLEYVSFLASIWVFGLLIAGGKSNWFIGAQSVGLYLIQALAIYIYSSQNAGSMSSTRTHQF